MEQGLKNIKPTLITIIVPVYNVQAYLPTCIDSLLAQTYKNLEIILVDDGSTDSCDTICDNYAKHDKRITVIHKKNSGLSAARNTGIDKANGRYVMFVDADDYMSTDAVEVLERLMRDTKVEISCALYKKVNDLSGANNSTQGNANLSKLDYKVLTISEALSALCYSRIQHSASCKLYARELFEQVRFPDGKIAEDMATVPFLISHAAAGVVMCDRVVYYYVQRMGSIAHSNHMALAAAEIEATYSIRAAFVETYPEIEDAVICRIVNTCFVYLFKLKRAQLHEAERAEMKSVIIHYRNSVLANIHARKKVWFACLFTYFGLLRLL